MDSQGGLPAALDRTPSSSLIEIDRPTGRAALNFARLNGAMWVLGDISSLTRSAHNWVVTLTTDGHPDPSFTFGFGSLSMLGLMTGSLGMAQNAGRFRQAARIGHIRDQLYAVVDGSRYAASAVAGGLTLAYRVTQFDASRTASKTSAVASSRFATAAAGVGIGVYSMMTGTFSFSVYKIKVRKKELENCLDGTAVGYEKGFEYLQSRLILSSEEIEEASQIALKADRPPKEYAQMAHYPLDPDAERRVRDSLMTPVQKQNFRIELVKRMMRRRAKFSSDISGAQMHRVQQSVVDGKLALTKVERFQVLRSFNPDLPGELEEGELHPEDEHFVISSVETLAKRYSSYEKETLKRRLRSQLQTSVKGVKKEIVEGARKDMRTNLKVLISAIAICAIGALLTAASLIVTGGIAGLLILIGSDLVSASMLGIDLYGLVQAFKNGDAGRYDHLIMTAVSVMLVAGVVMAGVLSAGIIPLVATVVAGAIMISIQSYLCYKTSRDQQKPLKAERAQKAIGSNVNVSLDLN